MTDFYCCEQGKEYISVSQTWVDRNGKVVEVERKDPYLKIHEYYEEFDSVDIKYCPFCGKKL